MTPARGFHLVLLKLQRWCGAINFAACGVVSLLPTTAATGLRAGALGLDGPDLSAGAGQ